MKMLYLLFAGLVLSAVAHAQGCLNNYVDPTFQLTKTDPGCMNNDGSISVINQQGGVAPFVYKLIETNTTNANGVFTGLAAGVYTISSTDACGSIKTRQATLSPYTFDFTYNLTKLPGCNGGTITVNATPAGGFTYGVIAGIDTTWSNSSTFTFPSLPKELKIIVYDACGNSKVKSWMANTGFLPYIKEIQYNLQCGRFDLFVIDYGFTNPDYCLYKADGTLVNCQTTPNFFNVPYGDYYFIVSDACYRDSMYQPNMISKGGSQLDAYNWDCNTFTMHVDGLEDTVCLYNAITNQKTCLGQDTVSINPRTGVRWPSGAVFTNLPYGSYYAYIYDPCLDSTFRIDSTVTYPFKNLIASIPACSLTETQVIVNFDPGSRGPYVVKIYYPNGALAQNYPTRNTNNYVGFTAYPGGGTITVIGLDSCGHADTAYVQQQSLSFTKMAQITNNCPGLTGAGGSGDVTVSTQTNDAGLIATPVIISKNGVVTSTLPNSTSLNGTNNTFVFTNLESATYILRYDFNRCGQNNIFDTVTITDYVYPIHNISQTNQCQNNPFTFRTSVAGGLSPYTYQIISNTPASPAISRAIQQSPIFTVGQGTLYSSVTVRSVDRCGNSTIGDVEVVPITGCSVLEIDSVRNAPLVKNKMANVFPNPSTSYFTISFSQKKKTNFRVEMMNMSGVRVYDKTIYNVDQREYMIKETFKPGIYIIILHNLATGQYSTFKQVIK